VLGWEELTEPERAVWEAVEAGSLVELPLGGPEVDDPAAGETWGQDRQIRAQLLYELLAGVNGPKDVRPRALRVTGARITGTLDLEATTLACPMSLRRCSFEQPINLQEVEASVVRLPGCHVLGLNARQLETRAEVELNDGFTANGEVNLIGAHIGGWLSFDGATLINPNQRALNVGGLKVEGGMHCRKGFRAEGEVRLAGAHIGGTLDLEGATITNPNQRALSADGLKVDGAFFARNGFRAEGEVRLFGAHIGMQASFNGATLINTNREALNAERLMVDQHMLCRNGFTAYGEVNLTSARIGGQLTFDRATFSNPNGKALRLQELEAAVLVLWLQEPPDGEVDFTRAHVGVLLQNQTSWPKRLRLQGFVYDSLDEGRRPITAAARLDWLARDVGPYTPQPYEQLVGVYRRAGREEDARIIAMAKQRRRGATLKLTSRGWNSLLRWTVGYGYQPWRAGLWLTGLWLLSALVFDATYRNGQITPAKKPEELQHFNPLVYALDVLLPIVNLGQDGGWVPHRFAAVSYWFLSLAGWVLTTALVAALTGLIKRD
jgi:hypothetical protein